jgi:hypothetical protein
MKTWREGKGLGLCVCWKLIEFRVSGISRIGSATAY